MRGEPSATHEDVLSLQVQSIFFYKIVRNPLKARRSHGRLVAVGLAREVGDKIHLSSALGLDRENGESALEKPVFVFKTNKTPPPAVAQATAGGGLRPRRRPRTTTPGLI